MKLTKISNLILLGLALTFTVVGCKKKPVGVTNIPGRTTRPEDNAKNQQPFDPNFGGVKIPSGGPAIDTSPGGLPPTADASARANWPKNADILKAQTVYFDFDKSSIRASEQPKLTEVANYLKSNPTHYVLVEGNCDERGTEEYNRSLGERRALAAREYLAKLGIDPNHIDTVTYGEDKPEVNGHDEAAWSKNRRDAFIVELPPSP